MKSKKEKEKVLSNIPLLTAEVFRSKPSKKRKPKTLKLELIPMTTLGVNVRSMVSSEEWDIIRKKVYKKADYLCEVCQMEDNMHPVECHEVWSFNLKTKTQKLIGLECLCNRCHKIKHSGKYFNNMLGWVIKELRKVNKWSKKVALQHIQMAYNKWVRRNEVNWKVNIDYIYEKGFLER